MTTRTDKIKARKLAEQTSAKELAAISAKIEAAKAELEDIESKIDAARGELADIQDELAYVRHLDEEESVTSLFGPLPPSPAPGDRQHDVIGPNERRRG